MKLFSTFLSPRFGGECHVIRYLMDVKNTFFYHGNIFLNAFPASLGIPRAEFLWLPPHAWTFAILNFVPLTFRQLCLIAWKIFFRIREIPFPALTTDCWMLCEVRGFASIYSPILKFDKFIHSHFSIFALCHAFMFHLSHYILQRISISQLNQFLFFLLKAWARARLGIAHG